MWWVKTSNITKKKKKKKKKLIVNVYLKKSSKS